VDINPSDEQQRAKNHSNKSLHSEPPMTPDNAASGVWFRNGLKGAEARSGQASRPHARTKSRDHDPNESGRIMISSSFALPTQNIGIDLARIAMTEVVELAIGHIGARRRQQRLGLPRHLDRKHPVEPAVRDVNGKP